MNPWTKRGKKTKQEEKKTLVVLSSIFVQEKKEVEAGDAVALCVHGDLGDKRVFAFGSKGVDGVSVPFAFVFVCDECCPPYDIGTVEWLLHVIPKLNRVGIIPRGFELDAVN